MGICGKRGNTTFVKGHVYSRLSRQMFGAWSAGPAGTNWVPRPVLSKGVVGCSGEHLSPQH